MRRKVDSGNAGVPCKSFTKLGTRPHCSSHAGYVQGLGLLVADSVPEVVFFSFTVADLDCRLGERFSVVMSVGPTLCDRSKHGIIMELCRILVTGDTYSLSTQASFASCAFAKPSSAGNSSWDYSFAILGNRRLF